MWEKFHQGNQCKIKALHKITGEDCEEQGQQGGE